MSRFHSLSIRAKTTLFVVLTLGLLIGLIAFISFTSSRARIETIEDERALEELDLVRRQLDNSIADLGATNSDWAWWNDALDYVTNRTPDFAEANLYAEAFDPIDVNLLAYLDAEGEVVFGTWYTDEERPVPDALLDLVRTGGFGTDFSADPRAEPGGVVVVEGTPFLVTSRAVLPSGTIDTEPGGTLLMGRVVDEGFVADLAELTGLDVDLTLCESTACEGLAEGPVIAKSGDTIGVTSVVLDLFDTPVLRLDIEGPRRIYSESITGIQSVLIAVIAAGLLAVLLTLVGLRRLLVDPLEQLGETVAAVGRTNDPSLRATVDRRDEIGRLAADLNVMLTRLERSQAELLNAKSEIEGASAAKSKFLSRVSHEVRTPLNGVLAYAQLLQLDELDPDAANSVDQIVLAARHIAKLVDDFLDIARIEAGAIPLHVEAVDTTALAAEVIAITQPVASEHCTRVTMTTSDSQPAAADPLRLRQVLINLVSNAIKYGGTTHPVEISTMQRGERSFVVVKDHGPGIPADQIHRLFVPFDRLDADKGDKGGTGIGLSVTKQLVELMNGTIDVVSEPGTGTAFIVSLPAAATDVASTAVLPSEQDVVLGGA